MQDTNMISKRYNLFLEIVWKCCDQLDERPIEILTVSFYETYMKLPR